MRALFPEFHVSENEVEGCVLHVDVDHTLCNVLFKTRKPEIKEVRIVDTKKEWIKDKGMLSSIRLFADREISIHFKGE